MNVGQLRKVIADLSDDTIILRSGQDHSQFTPRISAGTTLFDSESRTYTEDFGEQYSPEAEYGKRITALIVE